MSSTPQTDIRSLTSRRRLAFGAGAGFSAALAVWGLSFLTLLESFESRTLDWRQRVFAAPTGAAEKVAVVLIDDASIDDLKAKDRVSWPWPRDIYEPIIDFLKDAGAAAIVFDQLFVDPHAIAGVDAVFAEAVRRSGIVSLAVKLTKVPGAAESEAAVRAKAAVSLATWPVSVSRGLRGIVAPFPQLVEAARGLGAINVLQDPDGVVRRADLLTPCPDASALVASLAFEGARAALGPRGAVSLRPGGLGFGGADLPLDAEGRALVRFYGPETTLLTRNAISVLRSQIAKGEGGVLSVSPADFAGRVVFIGVHASGMEDIHSSPMGVGYRGPEFHATVCANLLGGEFLRQPGPLGRLFLLLLLGVASGVAAAVSWRPLRVVASAVLIAAGCVLAACGAYLKGLALDAFFPTLVTFGSAGSVLVLAYLMEGRQKREVARAFAQYLSPEVVRDLLREPGKLRLGGETREITVYFSDIAGFSTFSEGMSPASLVAFLNEYLSVMTDTILDHRGVIDKYEGDAIMAFWGAPLADERQAEEACLAVLAQQAAVRLLNERFVREGRPALRFRAGINKGPAVVGNMGSTRRFAYTAMGDTVNLASRLEGANKFFSTGVLVSDAARRDAGDGFAWRRMGRVRVVGRAAAVEVHELLGRSADFGEDDRGRLARYHVALERLEAGDVAAALDGLAALAAEAEDVVVNRLLDRARRVAGARSAWDGVWVLESKG